MVGAARRDAAQLGHKVDVETKLKEALSTATVYDCVSDLETLLVVHSNSPR